MSTNSLLNPKFNTVRVVRGINLNNSGLTNVSSINGSTISPSGLDSNPVNVIFRQGAITVPGSNIVGLWSDVITLANKSNVNQCVNIFFDDSLSSPCLINVSYDFKGRANFFSFNNTLIEIIVRIVDTYVISGINKIEGIQLLCESITGPNLILNQILNLENYCLIGNTPTALVPSIVLNNTAHIIKLHNLSMFGSTNNPAVPLIRLINNAQLRVYNSFNRVLVPTLNNSISDDGTGTVTIHSDASWPTYPTFSSFTGSYNKSMVDRSELTYYDDSKTPNISTTNVQDSIDYLKQNYALSNSTNSLTAGSTSVSSLNVSGLTPSQVISTDGSSNLVSSGYTVLDFMKSSLFFGNGSDGAITYSDGLTRTLTKHMYYTTLTLTNSSIIQTAGYRIFASVAITGDGTGIIKAGGFDATGQNAGIYLNSNMSSYGLMGIQGGRNGGNINTDGDDIFSATEYGGVIGGHGGNSDTNNGGNPQTTTFTSALIQSILQNTVGFMNNNSGIISFGSGGAGGAGGSTGTGGGGGSGGGCCYIITKSIGNINLNASGGNGGDAVGTGGVGGGGNGGIVFVVYQTATGGFGFSNCNVNGGLIGVIGNTTSATNGENGYIQLTQLT